MAWPPPVRSGHRRYAHIAALRRDSAIPSLLETKRVRGEDAVRVSGRAEDLAGAEPNWKTYARRRPGSWIRTGAPVS